MWMNKIMIADWSGEEEFKASLTKTIKEGISEQKKIKRTALCLLTILLRM